MTAATMETKVTDLQAQQLREDDLGEAAQHQAHRPILAAVCVVALLMAAVAGHHGPALSRQGNHFSTMTFLNKYLQIFRSQRGLNS
uniref:Uncharacterized protein n=1 Tax=Aegilops tauschii subsp. strangulata TaxID=200361 RepID=A0A453J7D6_AEGTS